MADLERLKEYDFLETFTGCEVAALIGGKSPEYLMQFDEPSSISPIYRRLAGSYEQAVMFGDGDPSRLVSISLQGLYTLRDRKNARDWGRTSAGAFDKQSFDRDEIVRWLKANGLSSAYQFELSTPVQKDGVIDVEKPLSNRERNGLLLIIGCLVQLIISPRPGRDCEAAVIREMIDNYSDMYGFSKRNLEDKFSESKKLLSQS